MAVLAKLLGVLSMFAAALVGLVAMFALGSIKPDWTDEAAGEAFLIAVGLGAMALLLATCGAGAYAAGMALEKPPAPVYFPQQYDTSLRR